MWHVQSGRFSVDIPGICLQTLISAMVFRQNTNVLTAYSSILTRMPGHIPRAERMMAQTERSITALVSGRAVKLVIMKYFGKEWNLIQASGPVKSWQEMESIALCHILLMGSNLPGKADSDPG